ncbi:MAG TPA: class I SAM-dependent methyltransferase, partial [Chitinophagaceae bacterium]|nr:class I SAM-dependent methyltransferase [Chitinophagaceae bacterium]
RKYDINTIKPESLKDLTILEGDISMSSPYEAVSYFILENLLDNFRRLFPEEKSLLDVGCGKGRVMVAAAHYGFKNITGVEFAKELYKAAEKNINKIKPQFPDTSFKIFCHDILNYRLDPDDKVFFLFNPFNKETMEKFSEQVNRSAKEYPRTIYFIYASPKHLETLLEKGYEIVFKIKKLKWLEGVILRKQTEQ